MKLKPLVFVENYCLSVHHNIVLLSCRILKKEKLARRREEKRKEKEQALKEGRPWPPKRKRSDVAADVGMLLLMHPVLTCHTRFCSGVVVLC